MKINLLVCGWLCCASLAFAQDDDCPSAVDAAEAQNPNAYKNCDYTKTGLNGILHQALSGKSEQSTASKVVVNKESKSQQMQSPPALVSADDFANPQELSGLKFGLLELAALKCPKGFALEEERYLPTARKGMRLELTYHCL